MTTTFYFQDVIPSLQDYTNIIVNGGIIEDTPTAQDITFINYTWRILFARYSFNSIAYCTPEEFITVFTEVLRQHFKQYRRELEIISKIQGLQDEQIKMAFERIVNNADNPNTMPENPREPLNYITAQNFEYGKSNALDAYMRALNNLPSTRADEFAAKFRFMFRSSYQGENVYYKNKRRIF